MPFIKRTDGNFTVEDKIKMFQQMGSVGAVLALAFIIVIETGVAGEYTSLAEMGLTAMIVMLAVSLVGSLYYKRKL